MTLHRPFEGLVDLNDKFTSHNTIPPTDATGIAVRPVGQDTWVASFTDSGASLLSPLFRAPDVGTGVGYSQAGGSLLITTGVNTNAEFLTRSLESWEGTMQLRYSFVASQRIANNNFCVMLADLIGENLACTINSATSITVAVPGHTLTAAAVGQFMHVGGITGAAGIPGRYAIASVVTGVSITFTVAGWPASGSCTVDLFGHSYVKHFYNGAVATSASLGTQRKGWQTTADGAVTVHSSASPGSIVNTHLKGREVVWSDVLRASSATPNITTRASRFEDLPDDDTPLYLFLWSYNGTAAPASTTTWSIGFCAVEKFANLPVFIQGQEMQGTDSAAPVTFTNTAIALAAGTNTIGFIAPAAAPTTYFVNSAASTNAALVLTGSSGLGALYATNTGAAVAYIKLYNKATAPTVGTDVPEMIIPVPAAAGGVPGVAAPPQGFSALRFPLGLGIAITGGAADTDTTAVAAGQVKVKISRTA